LGMFAITRDAILRWWRKRFSFYIHVHEQEQKSSSRYSDNDEYRIGGKKRHEANRTLDEKSMFNFSSQERNCHESVSSASSSHFDVTSISSLQENSSQIPIVCTSSYNSDEDLMNRKWPPPTRKRQFLSHDDIVLSRPFPFTHSRSFSTASVVSIDSLAAIEGWDPDGPTINATTGYNVNAAESFRYLTSSTSTTDDHTQTYSWCDHHDFFIQHMQFLRNQTRRVYVRDRPIKKIGTKHYSFQGHSSSET
jgi:hypothetical protein